MMHDSIPSYLDPEIALHTSYGIYEYPLFSFLKIRNGGSHMPSLPNTPPNKGQTGKGKGQRSLSLNSYLSLQLPRPNQTALAFLTSLT